MEEERGDVGRRGRFRVPAAALAWVVAALAIAPAAATPTLLMHSSLAGNADDDSGNGRHGTVDGVGTTTGRDGTANGALFWDDGNSAYVSFPSSVTSSILGNSPRTICAWVEIDVSYFGSNAFHGGSVWSYGDKDSTNMFILKTKKTNEKWSVKFGDNYRNFYTVSGTGSGWHFYCVTYASGTWTFYVDGDEVDSDSLTLTTTSTYSLWLGRHVSRRPRPGKPRDFPG